MATAELRERRSSPRVVRLRSSARALARPVPSIPATDAAALRRPWIFTTVVRLGLAVALVALLGGALLTARRLDAPRATFLPTGTTGVVVLDLSQSVTDLVYRRIANTLRMVSSSSDPVGMIAFSDVAYELFPPGAPPSELRSFARFFNPKDVDEKRFGIEYPENPWNQLFSAGTSISSGLGYARRVLERDGIDKGSVLLVSDLDTAASDHGRLSWMIARYRADRIELRVVPLFATPQDKAFFARLLGEQALVTPPELAAERRRQAEGALVGSSASTLVLLAGLIALALAANEWWCRRLDLPGARA